MANKITGLNESKTFINKTGKRLRKDFQSEIIKRSRALSDTLQKGINSSVDRGATAFTSRAMLMTYRKTSTGVSTTILVKDIQAQYLYEILVQPKATDKFVPTSAARLTAQGNIAGLKKNLSNGRYKVIKGKNGKERLVDTSKKKTKRIIGVREEKQRKMIYDFYAHAEEGARLMISDIRGTLRITK
ncbi:hypothetical protein [Kosakonia radicincitans]|uniref:hypothetical protein n=1 Tax=Kosakonia radicincitans TaxID=283686 RepID=UPI002368123C|nr:hypothetical protein [Kosakonia radicincitans]MDD7993754.1 hypothetical protein [Kosakonia radicincitans]